jgi:hypothetical protein
MKNLLAVAAWLLLSLTLIAQQNDKGSVVIGSMTNKPNALLVVNPQHSDQGVLLPQLSTAQRNALQPSSPGEDGLIVYDKSLNTYFYWSNGAWVSLHNDNTSSISYYSIDPANFEEIKPDNTVRDNHVTIFESDNTFVTPTSNKIGENIIAAINLPHGAVILEVIVYYMDNDANNLTINLSRKSLSGGNESIITWESAGTIPEVRSEVFDNFNGMEVADRQNYTYRIGVTFDITEEYVIDEPLKAKQRIYGVGIKYQE